MESTVLRRRHNLQIFGSIVGAVPIDVMHYFVITQRSADDRLGDQAVFEHISATTLLGSWVTWGINGYTALLADDPPPAPFRIVATDKRPTGKRARRPSTTRGDTADH
jgi:hypothetical protein